jgi:hypothetical protein
MHTAPAGRFGTLPKNVYSMYVPWYFLYDQDPWMDDGWRATVLYMVQSIIPRRAQAQSGPSKYIDGPSESGMKLFTTIGPVGADADADACPTSIATDVRPVLFSSALPESNGTRSGPDRA